MSRTRPARRFFVFGGLWLVMMLCAGAVIAYAQETEESLPQHQRYEFPIQVSSVDVQVRGSAPAQVGVAIEGTIGDGCTRLERIEQERAGNAVSVRIVGQHSGEPICTMIAQLYRDNVGLDGTFEPGSYTLDVNGVVREFVVQ
jgi:hypothetical protein